MLANFFVEPLSEKLIHKFRNVIVAHALVQKSFYEMKLSSIKEHVENHANLKTIEDGNKKTVFNLLRKNHLEKLKS